MDKILLVFKREYSVRVKKRSFVIMTLLSPLLFGAIMVVPTLLALKGISERQVIVVDESRLFADSLTDVRNINFIADSRSLNQILDEKKDDGKFTILHIPPFDPLSDPDSIKLISTSSVGIDVQSTIERQMEDILQSKRFELLGIERQTVEKTYANVRIKGRVLDEEGEKDSFSAIATAAGFIGGFVIYMFIFIYGATIMRGVIEEKTNRIVEIIISSVKPFQLMLGKVTGLGAVALTQILIWVVLTGAISAITGNLVAQRTQPTQFTQVIDGKTEVGVPLGASPDTEKTNGNEKKLNKLFTQLSSLNWLLLVGSFVFYFIGGYLFYGSLFAAAGSAVDSETDAQQFTLPITLPMIVAMMLLQTTVQEPDSALSFWLSILPFTSPVTMMARLPFGVPAWQLGLSMVLLMGGFLGATWLAGRIYRVGILMYGKKPTMKELGKWIFYKD